MHPSVRSVQTSLIISYQDGFHCWKLENAKEEQAVLAFNVNDGSLFILFRHTPGYVILTALPPQIHVTSCQESSTHGLAQQPVPLISQPVISSNVWNNLFAFFTF